MTTTEHSLLTAVVLRPISADVLISEKIVTSVAYEKVFFVVCYLFGRIKREEINIIFEPLKINY